MSRRATAPAGPPHRCEEPATSTVPEPESVPVLTEPADGVPPIVESETDLLRAADAVAAGTGPVALDAERASGFRYSGRAYLVQLRRAGAGTWLIDPIACPDLSPIQEAIGDAEWILHAATQDLPCLAEVGLHPTRLFDTELGGRLAGLPRVGLSAVVEHYLGVSLAKEHSAADWSERPLPAPWLLYAALDVEVLIEVRERMAADLESQDKAQIAAEEFEALTHFTGPPVRTDPWRRTSGTHTIRDRRGLARLRALWHARDEIARKRDTAPGRIIPDKLMAQIAAVGPTTEDQLQEVAAATGRSSRGRTRPPHRGLARYRKPLLDAVREANALPERKLPPKTIPSEAPPPARSWADRDPVAAARLAQVRAALAEESQHRSIPVENLLTPDMLRRVLWDPPEPLDAQTVADAFAALGARPWQIALVAPLVVSAATDHQS